MNIFKTFLILPFFGSIFTIFLTIFEKLYKSKNIKEFKKPIKYKKWIIIKKIFSFIKNIKLK